MQRIYERQLASHLYSGETSHGQAYIHLDDAVDAIERVVERRAQLAPEVAILIGEAEALSYDELQHTFQRLILGESWETHNVPGLIAKAGAWVEEHMPGKEAFIKPWMIDRANDHYALDITRARALLEWAPRRSLRETLPKLVAALKADPVGWYRGQELEPPPCMTKTAEGAVPEAAKPPDRASRPEQAPASGHAHGIEYTCPMHPEVVRSEPGSCPKCGMTRCRAAPPRRSKPASLST